MQLTNTQTDGTHCLCLHPEEYDIEHLCESGLGCGLVDEVLTGQVDIVTCPHRLQHGALVYLTGVGCHNGQ